MANLATEKIPVCPECGAAVSEEDCWLCSGEGEWEEDDGHMESCWNCDDGQLWTCPYCSIQFLEPEYAIVASLTAAEYQAASGLFRGWWNGKGKQEQGG